MEKKNKKLTTVLFVILNIAVIVFIAFSEFNGQQNEDILPDLSSRGMFYIMCAVGCLAAALFAETSKYILLMRTFNEKISWRSAFETAALGKYYDSITPSGIGGQPFQIYHLHKRGYSDGASYSMPVLCFISMQTGFILMAAVTFITWRSVELEAIRVTAYLGLFSYMLAPLILVAFALKPKATEKMVTSIIHFGSRLHIVKDEEKTVGSFIGQLSDFHNSFSYVSGKKKTLASLVILSLIYQAAICSISYFVIMAMGGADSYMHIFAATIYVMTSMTLIITPGNSGAAEGVFYLVFSSIGSDDVFWAMLIWRGLSYYSFIAIGGLIYGFNAIEKRFNEKRKINEG